MRHSFSYFLGITLLFFSVNSHAGAEFIDYPSNLSMDQVVDQLSNLNWIPDGKENDKIVYVFAAPWCPVCHEFYKETRTLSQKVQFRWLMAGSKDSESMRQNQILALSRDPTKLNELFQSGDVKGQTSLQAEMASSAIITTRHALIKPINSNLGQVAGFPVMVYYTSASSNSAGNWRVRSGLPADLTQIIDRVEPRPSLKSITPLCDKFTRNPLKVIDTPQKPYTPKTKIYIYSYPSTKSLRLVSLTPDFAVDAKRTVELEDGTRWIQIELYGPGLGGWAREQDFNF